MVKNDQKNETPSNFKHIVRIANVDVPGDKSIRISLTKIKGIGINFSDVICLLAKVDHNEKTGYLKPEQVAKLSQVINNPKDNGVPTHYLNRRRDFETGEDEHFITGKLNFILENTLKRLKKIKTLRGMRHQRKLPVRGQRTRSNFRRSKGKVVGVKKKK
jgi:small subunit ribosomal protein S13